MLDNRGIEDCLLPHKDRIMVFFLKNGTAATVRFIKSMFKLKVKGETVRRILEIPKSNHNLIMELKQDAWRTCGYPRKTFPDSRGYGRALVSKRTITTASKWSADRGGIDFDEKNDWIAGHGGHVGGADSVAGSSG